MQYTTEEYRNEMKLPYRGKSHVYIYLGLINNIAQREARITSSFSGTEQGLYDTDPSVTYQGVTSTENDGSITFTFGDYYELNIRGLQLKFGGDVESITVTNGEKEETYYVYGDTYEFDDGYENCHYMTITPSSGKLNIRNIIFGIGLQFSDRQIINTYRQNEVSHISNELPSKRFSFTIDNRLHMYNKDNPDGYANYVREQQKVTYEYTRELTSGSEYHIKGGVVYINDWSNDDYTATFNCVGKLDFLTADYYKGQYYQDGISAYDLAEQVFQDAGVEDYKIDFSLRNVIFNNPLPIMSHRECLQMIANASRATLYEDRDGNICLSNGEQPNYIDTIEFHGATDYSIASTLFMDNTGFNYADAEYGYPYANGELMFLPEKESYVSTGFVSDEIANSNGTFSNDPYVMVKLVSEYKLKQLFLIFAYVVPTSMTLTFYLGENEVDNIEITSIGLTTVVPVQATVDSFKIRFNSVLPNQRIHLNSAQLDGYVDYDLTYHEMKSPPIVSSLEKVTKINTTIYTLKKDIDSDGNPISKGTTIKQIDTENEGGGITANIITSDIYQNTLAVIDAVVGDNLVTFSTPSYDYEVDYGTIKESGAYYLIVTSDIPTEIKIQGKTFIETKDMYSIDVHEEGIEKTSKNPLISSITLAKQQASWLKQYYDDDLDYSIVYRGDPIIDADDLIYVENKFVHLNEIRIESETISTSLGMDFSCTLVGRRTSYLVEATLDRAIVGMFRVGDMLQG